MSMNLHPGPPGGTLIISALVVLNAIVLEEGFITDRSVYWWLLITVPMLLLALFSIKQTRHALPGNGTLTKKSHQLK